MRSGAGSYGVSQTVFGELEERCTHRDHYRQPKRCKEHFNSGSWWKIQKIEKICILEPV
jgi:hypothetical protein